MRSWMFLALASGCGFSTSGVATDATTGGGSDAAIDGPPVIGEDASNAMCFGTGFGRTCLTALPTTPRSITTSIDTAGPDCLVINNLCVLTGTTIDIPAGAVVRAIGPRPLVLLATQTLTVSGTMGASAIFGQAAGAGFSTSPCASPAAASDDAGGAAGGAGGSFGGKGGDGGDGDLNDSGLPAGSATGQAAAAATAPTTVRAGCAGGTGGNGVGAGGAGGRGGGAIYFIAGTSISVTGMVFSVGEGGRGANNLGGGGGGGSGGLLGFDAPMISLAGFIIANGGGGGEGAALGGAANGAPGGGGTANGDRALGGSGTNGGDGGDSSGDGSAAGIDGTSVNEGGGGGGGGAGYVYVKGSLISGSSATISPTASVTP